VLRRDTDHRRDARIGPECGDHRQELDRLGPGSEYSQDSPCSGAGTLSLNSLRDSGKMMTLTSHGMTVPAAGV
jgi:hypothetical protein